MQRVSLTGGGHRLNNLAANKKVSAPTAAGPSCVAIHISLRFSYFFFFIETAQIIELNMN